VNPAILSKFEELPSFEPSRIHRTREHKPDNAKPRRKRPWQVARREEESEQ
jgi:hypothetical protein